MMAGTISEFYDYDEKNTLNSFELLSAWIFGKVNPDCILLDISTSGCSILTPRKKKIPDNPIKIAIMSPDDDNRVHTVIAARLCWSDADYSTSNQRCGYEFINIDNDTVAELKILQQHIIQLDRKVMKCSTLGV